ncbi:MAG: NUDIX hydrolase [Bacteroidia bacterium]|nr:NUDIX hydrolase [Bacteroidia bacterium]MCX7763405.1 NUDIX hydrolase [Bacteroidia bacterium]MDW8057952.1 NUDIX hydrolase [Bacteroidia bacterium]
MRWIVRVYALIPDGEGRYLVLEEYFRGGQIMKFPGGGVHPYESLSEALRRELKEELDATPASMRHFYTTDFYQRSYYHDSARLLAIYYVVELAEPPQLMNPRSRLYWLPPSFMALTFPVDRYVRRLLMQG